MRILTWNILAQTWYKDNKTFSQKERFDMIVKYIMSYNPDVICLQEIDYFDTYWNKALQEKGFTSYYMKRPTSGKNDGSLIATKDTTTRVLSTQKLNLNYAKPSKAPQALQERYHRNNEGIIARCKHEEKECIIATAHLFFDPHCLDVKLKQGHYIWNQIERFSGKKTDETVCFAGDLNSEPHEQVVRHFKQHLNDPFVEQQKEGKITTKTKEFSAWLDYIFTNTHIESVSKVPTITHPIPNNYYPSDHIPLVIDQKI